MSDNTPNFVLPARFTIRLRMLSDWHVGTGTGIPGSIDSLLVRDREGFPFVPAKSIVGIWRDALETLTFGLDQAETGNAWQQWANVIFGNQPNVHKIPVLKPRPAILCLEPARLSKGLRETIKSKEDIRLKQALTFIKPEIKIEERSGTAETDMLRAAEMGRIGTILETACELDFDSIENVSVTDKKTISALLIASAKLVERIGGKRRRGSGKCELTIVEGPRTLGSVVEFLRTHPSAVPDIKEEKSHHDFAPPDSGRSWQKLRYTLTLKTPVAIVTKTLGNVSETLDFIPGTYLLPHITRGRNLFKHVANGDLQISPATIKVNGKRGLPVPVVLYYDKLGGGFGKQKSGDITVYNRFDGRDKLKIQSGDQKKNYRDGYVSSLAEAGKLPHYSRVAKTLLTHNTVEDDVQRPTETVGGVYSRQAIPPGSILCGEIRFKSAVASQLSNLNTQEVRIGTSKKDDYGLAQLEFETLQAADSTATAGKELIVYLESDVLLRNDNVRQATLVDDLKGELQKRLSMGLNKSLRLSEGDSLIQTRRIESWHESWGFPRPTLIAIQAGSCTRFEIEGFEQLTTDDKKLLNLNLQSLEAGGIGERRGEGYGRIRFNPRLLTEPISDWRFQEPKHDDPLSLAVPTRIQSGMKDFAEQIEIATWREELQRAVLLIADQPEARQTIFGFEKGGKPSMSQIGGLRSVIGRMRKFSDGKHVTAWLTHLEETENRLDKWAQDRQIARKKLERIKNLIAQDSKVWLILCETKVKDKNIWQSPPTLVRTAEELQEELWAEAIRALFDACGRAHKRDGGGN